MKHYVHFSEAWLNSKVITKSALNHPTAVTHHPHMHTFKELPCNLDSLFLFHNLYIVQYKWIVYIKHVSIKL